MTLEPLQRAMIPLLIPFEQIKIKKFPIDVESVKVSFEEYKGEFPYFKIKTGIW